MSRPPAKAHRRWMSRNCLKRRRTACFRRARRKGSADCAVISLFIGRKSANTGVSSARRAEVRENTAICPLVSGRSSNSAYPPFAPGRKQRIFAASGMNRGGQAAEICSGGRRQETPGRHRPRRSDAQNPAKRQATVRIRAGEQGGGIGGVKGILRQCGANRAARSAGDGASFFMGRKSSSNDTRTTSDTSSSWCTTRTRFRPPRWRGRASQRRSETGRSYGRPLRVEVGAGHGAVLGTPSTRLISSEIATETAESTGAAASRNHVVQMALIAPQRLQEEVIAENQHGQTARSSAHRVATSLRWMAK